MPGSTYRITGRIREGDGKTGKGYVVQAFAKDPRVFGHPDDRLGKAELDASGSFSMTFGEDAFKDWFENEPSVYLVVRDEDGVTSLQTSAKKNLTTKIDFQIKMGRVEASPNEPDIYTGNLDRMIAALNGLGDTVDVSRDDVVEVSKLLLGALTGWTAYRDTVEAVFGYDGVQVPEQPRREGHVHVTRWDEEVLPI